MMKACRKFATKSLYRLHGILQALIWMLTDDLIQRELTRDMAALRAAFNKIKVIASQSNVGKWPVIYNQRQIQKFGPAGAL